VIKMNKEEKIAGLIRKVDLEISKIYCNDYEDMVLVYRTFLELVRDVIEEKI